MIDTDKYEGHTPADEWESHLIDALFETEFPMTYADNQLMADAPLILEAYKRLCRVYVKLGEEVNTLNEIIDTERKKVYDIAQKLLEAIE